MKNGRSWDVVLVAVWFGVCGRVRKWRLIRRIKEVSTIKRKFYIWHPSWWDHLSKTPIILLACSHLTHCHHHGLMDGLVWCATPEWLCDLCRVRQGTECFQQVLLLDNCAHVVGTTLHTYALGQSWLSFPYSFVLTPPVPYAGMYSIFPFFTSPSFHIVFFILFSFPFSHFLLSPVSFFPVLFSFSILSFNFLLCPFCSLPYLWSLSFLPHSFPVL